MSAPTPPWVPAPTPLNTDPVSVRIVDAVARFLGAIGVAGNAASVGVGDGLVVGDDTDEQSLTERVREASDAGAMFVEIVPGLDSNLTPIGDGGFGGGGSAMMGADVFTLDVVVQFHLPATLPAGLTHRTLAARCMALVYAQVSATMDAGGDPGSWGGRWNDPAEGPDQGKALALYSSFLDGPLSGGVFVEPLTRGLCTACSFRVTYRVRAGNLAEVV